MVVDLNMAQGSQDIDQEGSQDMDEASQGMVVDRVGWLTSQGMVADRDSRTLRPVPDNLLKRRAGEHHTWTHSAPRLAPRPAHKLPSAY